MAVADRPGLHVDENAIAGLLDGGLSGAETSQIRQHLDTCRDCLALVMCTVKARDDVGSLQTRRFDVAAGSGHFARAVLAEGMHVGPYTIERLVGAGGMGVVYA